MSRTSPSSSARKPNARSTGRSFPSPATGAIGPIPPSSISPATTPKDDRVAYELGGNLFVYATGQDIPRNRLDALYVPELPGVAKYSVPVARLKHGGDWDPEPYAWTRESRLFRRETSIALEPTP